MLIDASDIVARNQGFLESSEWAMQNVQTGNAAIDVLRASCGLPLDQPNEIVVLRLAIRLINAAGAAGDATLNGYYQPAASQIRDLVEVGFLLDIFRRDPARVERWRTVENKVRKTEFGAHNLRKELDALDGSTNKLRDGAYSFFSRHGTHADPDSIVLNSPKSATEIGPFPDRDRVLALSFDLARYLAAATEYFIMWLMQQRSLGETQATQSLFEAVTAFREKVDMLAKRKDDPRG